MISKLFWLVVAAVAVVLLVPQLREKVWPKVQPAFNPLYEWNARNEVNEIRDIVKRADAMGRTVPVDEANFITFVNNEAMQQNASVDPWGTPFYIVLNGNQFQIGSAGKDRQAGTSDDIMTRPETVTHVADNRRRF